MNKKQLKLKKFRTEDEERSFWKNLDLSDYFHKNDFVPMSFPDLKPSSHPVSIRIPDYLITRLKERANKLNIPYQSLMKQYIARGVLGSEQKELVESK